ncbi:Uncharacterized protein TCM_004866 [Theobroma cacao]|uniref:Uncharacterized protein n=1 Tax=Theobroma cacao TaxID=3641 RepID=A0A061DRB8_THECC|nr:Uncharacterized protein TCM_004866 [Theobroma cacao]
MKSFPRSLVLNFPVIGSNHYPIVINACTWDTTALEMFWFENMWVENIEYDKGRCCNFVFSMVVQYNLGKLLLYIMKSTFQTKEVLIKAVASVIHVHVMNCCKISKKIYDQVNFEMAGFWQEK